MRPQLSSFRTSIRALFITPNEGICQIRTRRIELNDASVISREIESTENTVQSWRYLITLSARASTLGGIVRPICLAVLRLTRNSTALGCSTGMSAGLTPLRILRKKVFGA